jgi:hypothetical protein
VEELIFNLCEGVETRATETKIEAYRRENAADIARRQQRNAEEDRRLGELAGTSGAGDGETAPKDPGADPWAPRRMSADVSDLDETPGPGAGGNARERKSDGFETNPRGFGGLFGYTPGSQTAHKQQVVPVPATAAPVPMSAGKLMEGGPREARAPPRVGRRRERPGGAREAGSGHRESVWGGPAETGEAKGSAGSAHERLLLRFDVSFEVGERDANNLTT